MSDEKYLTLQEFSERKHEPRKDSYKVPPNNTFYDAGWYYYKFGNYSPREDKYKYIRLQDMRKINP